MPPDMFEQRLQLLQAARCNVLPFSEGVERLYAGTLPHRSVVLTFDDGYHDFVAAADPLLKKYGIPSTVYLPTLHCGRRAPVFSPCAAYILWKARGSLVPVPFIRDEPLDLRSVDGRASALAAVKFVAKRDKLTLDGKQRLLRDLADRLQVDFDAILAKRVLQIMDAEDATRLAR